MQQKRQKWYKTEICQTWCWNLFLHCDVYAAIREQKEHKTEKEQMWLWNSSLYFDSYTAIWKLKWICIYQDLCAVLKHCCYKYIIEFCKHKTLYETLMNNKSDECNCIKFNKYLRFSWIKKLCSVLIIKVWSSFNSALCCFLSLFWVIFTDHHDKSCDIFFQFSFDLHLCCLNWEKKSVWIEFDSNKSSSCDVLISLINFKDIK